jgi:hypothetical protein
MADLLTVEDLQAAKQDDTFHAEVITGKVGGAATGASIDYATHARTGQVQKTLPAIMRDNGVRNVGLFVGGVTFTAISDVAYDGSGNGWIYLGDYPFTATAGTVPSEPTYKQVSVKSHNYLTDRDAVGAHDTIYRRSTTVAEIGSGVFSVGDILEITDRANAQFDVVSGGTADGYSILDAGNGNTAVYSVSSDGVNLLAIGAVPYESGSKIENAAINDIVFALGIDLGWNTQTRTYTNGFHFCVSQKFIVKQLSPVDVWPYTNNQELSFNSIIENIGTDYWLKVESQSAPIYINEQRGEGSAKGIYVTKQGDSNIRVGTSRGLKVEYNNAFSHTIHPGLFVGSDISLNLDGSNAIKVIGGRIGGNFTLSDTDDTTSDIGVNISQGTANMIVGTNVEYCKKTNDSWGIVDNGVCTYINGGYLESCSGGLIKASGRNGRFDIQTFATGVYAQKGIQDTGVNNWFFVQTTDTYGYPNSDNNNSTLSFVYPALSYQFNQTSRLNGPNKHLSVEPIISKWNKLQSSSRFEASIWSYAPIAGFSGHSVNYNAEGSVQKGFPIALELNLPVQDSSDKQFSISQSGAHLTMTAGNIFTAGAYFRCLSGKVDVMIKVLVDDNYYTHRFSLSSASDGSNTDVWQALQTQLDVAATSPTLNILFRPTENSVIRVFGVSLYEFTDVGAVPPSDSTRADEVKLATDNESVMSNGAFINGNLRCKELFLGTSDPLTEFNSPLYITGLSQTLPSPSRTKGKIAIFKNIGGSPITISGSIDGGASYPLAAQEKVTLFSTGSEYYSI